MTSKRKRAYGNPAKRAWHPMGRGTLSPVLASVAAAMGDRVDEAWMNDLYQCVVRHKANGMTHLSIKRHDRAAVRDWRHLQAIKNDVCGEEREGVELFPAESRLVDTANEYHIWVLPLGERFEFGYAEGYLMTAENNADFNQAAAAADPTGGSGKGKQRPWQPGITTGLGGEHGTD